MNALQKMRLWLGWCPNAGITELKTRRIEYEILSANEGLPIKKWKFDLLIIGHVCALLFASLFILPMSAYQAFDLYNSPYLALNYGQFLTNIILSITSALFSIATLSLIYNILIFKKLYSKLCYFNIILLSGLFAAIILELSLLNGNYRLEWSIYWAFVFALLPSIPSFISISLDKKYGGQKVVKEGIGLAEIIKRALGWCPNENVIKSMPSIRFQNIAIENVSGAAPNENTVLWLSRLFGALNLPVAFIAVIDIIGAFSITPPDFPRTLEQWMGFLTAVSAIAGAAAGLTARSQHSLKRKLMHMLIAALGVIMFFIALIGHLLLLFAVGYL